MLPWATVHRKSLSQMTRMGLHSSIFHPLNHFCFAFVPKFRSKIISRGESFAGNRNKSAWDITKTMNARRLFFDDNEILDSGKVKNFEEEAATLPLAQENIDFRCYLFKQSRPQKRQEKWEICVNKLWKSWISVSRLLFPRAACRL